MGGNILRRASLTAFLMAVTGLRAAFPDAGPLPPERFSLPPKSDERAGWLPPQQNHAAPKSWSVGDVALIAGRPETAFWIERWNSPEGRKKLRLSLERYFPYRGEVDAIIRESGLPWEIAAIPFVESNWRINAVSSSGAVGPWQFLEASARGRDLVIDAWRDDRRDVWRSTEAAMKELAFYDRLFDDWLLAIASYNAGPTRIRRIRVEGGYGGYWDMLDDGVLPPETRAYVPQVVAVTWVLSHAGRLGLPLNWEESREWTRIPASRSVHLASLAGGIGVARSVIDAVHGELNHPVTPPPTLPYFIKVPSDSAAVALRWLEELEQDDAPERFWKYTVRSGDTLSGIAVRSGISLSELLSYNGHVRSGVLRIGEKLYLPGNEQQPPGADRDDLPAWTGRYRVETGDSFWSIARHFGVSPESLAEANHRPMDGTLLAGSILKVPGGEEEL